MAVTFLEVAQGLVYDEAEKAAFARDPAGYLAARGLDGLDADDVADAVRFAVDNLPAPIARDITSQLDASGQDETHGLAALVAVEPPLTDLADPGSLDDWDSPLDADQVQPEVAGDAGDGPAQERTLEELGRDATDAADAADASESPGNDILAEGFGQGADVADPDLADAAPEHADDPVMGGDAAPAWDLGASDDVDTADPLPAQDAGEQEPIGLEPDMAVDPPLAAESPVDDGADPDDLGF